MTTENYKEKASCNYLPKVGFTSYIYPYDLLDSEDHDRAWTSLIKSTNVTGPLELQYEPYFETGYWKSMDTVFFGLKGMLSVHAPTHDRDTASNIPVKRSWSLQEYKSSMDLTNLIKGSSFILHLTPQDQFEDRDVQLEQGINSFRELTVYKRSQNYGFKTLIENLEYPKWPSDMLETEQVIIRTQEIDPKIGFCVDVAHLWHNVTTLYPNPSGNSDFPAYLDTYLKRIEQYTSVERFHFGGAFVEEKESGDRHETHYFPGLAPDTELAEDTLLYFYEKPENFRGKWMEINPVLKVISEFSRQKYKNTGKKPDIVIEIHDPNPNIQRKAAKIVKEQLNFIDALK